MDTRKPAVIVLQMRAHRAGSQVALTRLFKHAAFRALNPLVVTRGEGWLSEQCLANGVSLLTTSFPTSRSLAGRLWGVRSFAKRVLSEMEQRGLKPVLVVANDHYEAMLAKEIAERAGIRSISFVRAADATNQDLAKYRIGEFDLLYPIGREFSAKVARWFPNVRVKQLDEGMEEKDFHPSKEKAKAFPRKILVVGSEHPMKGWADMTAAIDLLERDPAWPVLEYDFTGSIPEPAKNDVRAHARRRSKLNFIGRQENFAQFVRGYDLVLHPSHLESFGMAVFEILAAGVPLLCSRTGEIERVRSASEWLHRPKDVEELASRLRFLHDHWDQVVLDTQEVQQKIRKDFMADAIADANVEDFKALISQPM